MIRRETSFGPNEIRDDAELRAFAAADLPSALILINARIIAVTLNATSRVTRELVMDITVSEELWASSMLPEGVVERWLVSNGATVEVGDRVAEVRIEDALHEIMAPASGRLTIAAAVNDIVEPGSVIGRLEP